MAAVLSVIAIAQPSASSAPESRERPRPSGYREATVTVHGKTVMAALGGYSLPDDTDRRDQFTVHTCADATGPPARGAFSAVSVRRR